MSHPPRKFRRKNGTRGFVHTAGLLEPQLRRASGSRGFSQIRLLTHWEDVVGPTLAKHTRPHKISYAKEGFGATLTVLVKGAHAPELQMQLGDIRGRVNACYGYNAIARVRMTQTDARAFEMAESQSPYQADTPAPDVSAEADGLGLKNVKDNALRDALMELTKNVLTRQRKLAKGNE